MVPVSHIIASFWLFKVSEISKAVILFFLSNLKSVKVTKSIIILSLSIDLKTVCLYGELRLIFGLLKVLESIKLPKSVILTLRRLFCLCLVLLEDTEVDLGRRSIALRDLGLLSEIQGRKPRTYFFPRQVLLSRLVVLESIPLGISILVFDSVLPEDVSERVIIKIDSLFSF